MNLKKASLFALGLASVAVIALVFRESLFAKEPIGIAVQVLAAFLMLWARLTFGRRSIHASASPTEGGVMTSGPYRYFRHPIYASMLYFIWTGILSHLSPVNTLLGAAVTVGLGVRMFAEERLVTKRYPEYAAYAARTKRVIPYIL